jgi:hypothetical protein
MGSYKFIALLFIFLVLGAFLAAEEVSFSLPTLIPEIISLGYGTYQTVSDISRIAEYDWVLESNYGTSLLIFDALYISGNSLSIASKIGQNDNHKIASRILIAGSVVAPVVWSLFSDTADGEDRFEIGLTRLLPAGFSFGFTFFR